VDANDYASSSRNTNFKPLVLDEIQTVGDRRPKSPTSLTANRIDQRFCGLRRMLTLPCGCHPQMHRCEFCKILLSYAKIYKIIQIFASICRRDTHYQRVHWGRR